MDVESRREVVHLSSLRPVAVMGKSSRVFRGLLLTILQQGGVVVGDTSSIIIILQSLPLVLMTVA